MASRTDVFDLGRLQLSSGSGRSVDLQVKLDTFEFGGQEYQVADDLVPIRLDATRTVAGYALRLRFEAEIDGPCMRCLEAAAPMVDVDDRQIDQPGDDEELHSEYVEGDELDVHAWSRDALALALPTQIVCAEECRGLCPVCGENLNQADPDHAHEEPPNPRWAKLSELRFE